MKKKYMNPYIAGTLLGLVLLTAMYLSGRGLGASGGLKYCVVSVVEALNPGHVAKSDYYSKYFEGGSKPLLSWLPFEVLGMLMRVFVGSCFGEIKT